MRYDVATIPTKRVLNSYRHRAFEWAKVFLELGDNAVDAGGKKIDYALEPTRFYVKSDRVPLRPGMSLPDAIRKGAAQHPQRVGGMFFHQQHPRQGITATCVLGAALVGVFGAATTLWDLTELRALYPELDQRVPTCPSGDACPTFLVGPYSGDGHSPQPLFATLAHVNDGHAWTREQCADWLEAR